MLYNDVAVALLQPMTEIILWEVSDGLEQITQLSSFTPEKGPSNQLSYREILNIYKEHGEGTGTI